MILASGSNESEDGSGSADPEKAQEKAESGGNEYETMEVDDDHTEEATASPATVFCISLKQPRSNLQQKMSFPELCRNFGAVAWCGKLNAIACASETCARIPSSNFNPPFWIPVHILIPERPTECVVFNVIADSPRDSVQFIDWSPASCPRALLIANVHGRVTIWMQPSHGSNVARDASLWHCEHEWRQDVAVITKWLSGTSPYRWPSSKTSFPGHSKSTFEEIFLAPHSETSESWPNFLCVCSVFASGSLQLHWAHWPPVPDGSVPKWFWTSKGLLGAGPSGIATADAIVTNSGALHVVGVPVVNPSTVVIWEVAPVCGNIFQSSPKLSISNRDPPVNPPNWAGFSSLAAYLFSWQEFLISGERGKNCTGLVDCCDAISLHCSPVSNFSAYISPETAAPSEAATTWGSAVTAVAFDPICGGCVVSVAIAEGQYMSPYDPDKGPTITGWRIQRWESTVQPVVLHPIFRNASSSIDEEMPLQTVWQRKIERTIGVSNDFRNQQADIGKNSDIRSPTGCGVEKSKMVFSVPCNLRNLPSDVRYLTRIIYSAHGGEVAIAFVGGSIHIFSGSSFTPSDSYQIDVGPAIAAPVFSPTSCCSASVWHDTYKDCTLLKIIRILPPCGQNNHLKANSMDLERAIAERFWWSLLVEVDWWDVVGCAHNAAEDNIVSVNNVIAILDEDFHALPSTQHRQQYGPFLDRIKSRLLEGIPAQEVRALVLDMQARLLLDMLGKGIESSLINPLALISEPWQASGETLTTIDPDTMAVDPLLVLSVQAYVDTVLDLASHFITRLRRYASFCRTLATHAANAGVGGNRNATAASTQSSSSTTQGPSSTPSSTGSIQMQAWVQGAIAKINSTAEGVSSSAVNPTSGPSSFMPISINTGTFPGTPAVRLIGDCHFLHRLCQLLLFSFFFRRTQFPRFVGISQKASDALGRQMSNGVIKVEDTSGVSVKLTSALKFEDVLGARSGYSVAGAKGTEDGPGARSRLGYGNAGQGYTFDEVKILFLIVMDLCRRTAGLSHPLPASQVGSHNIQVRLHYIEGNYTVLPEVVEASLGPHMQNMPRPRGADAAGLLLRELELHPPSEEWHRRNMYGGPWSNPEDTGCLDDIFKRSKSDDTFDDAMVGNEDPCCRNIGLWPRKRRISERDAAFGISTSAGLGRYLGIMGSRRDVISSAWKTGFEGVWYKCVRCLRQTSAFTSPGATELTVQNEREIWWISRWAYGCPMCGGAWVRVV